MTRKRRYVLPCAALVWLLAVTSSHADGPVFLVPDGTVSTVIGHFVDDNTWMISIKGNGSCLGAVLGPHGLQTNVTIQGTSLNDSITVIESGGMSLCGISLAPPKRNGHRITLSGGSGQDTLMGGDSVFGGDGDDRIYLSSADISTAVGGAGNDVFWGNFRAQMAGEGGNDAFCIPVAPALTIDGGTGSDSWCTLDGSNMPATQVFGVESPHNCTQCL